MVRKDEWVWVVLQDPGENEQFLGQYDEEKKTSFIPTFLKKEEALQCNDCHGENGRMDWEALGYYGDPIRWGGRSQTIGLNEYALHSKSNIHTTAAIELL